MKAYWGMEI